MGFELAFRPDSPETPTPRVCVGGTLLTTLTSNTSTHAL